MKISKLKVGSTSTFDLAKFTAFFKRGCEASVVIPMLTLNSGICGSIWEQIQMITGANERVRPIAQRDFDAGVRYFSRLKRFSATYLAASGFQFTAREDAPPGFQSLVTFAVRQHLQIQSSAGAKAAAFLGA